MDISEKEAIDCEEPVMDKKTRRSSILKPQKQSKSTEDDCDFTIKASRRVSFASSNFVKPFAADPEKNTIWDLTYEEEINHTDSTKSSCEKFDLFNTTSIISVDNVTAKSIPNYKHKCQTGVRKPFMPLVTDQYIANKENIFIPPQVTEQTNENLQSEYFYLKTEACSSINTERPNRTMYFENSQQNMEFTANFPVLSNFVTKSIQPSQSILKNHTIYYNVDEADMEFTSTLIPPQEAFNFVQSQKSENNGQMFQNNMNECRNYKKSGAMSNSVKNITEESDTNLVRNKTVFFQSGNNSMELTSLLTTAQHQSIFYSNQCKDTMDFTSNLTSAEIQNDGQHLEKQCSIINKDISKEQLDNNSMDITSNLCSVEIDNIQDVESPKRQTVCSYYRDIEKPCNSKLSLRLESSKNTIHNTNNDINIPYPQSSNRSIHFQSDDSMEFTSMLPTNNIIINDNSNLNLVTKTEEKQSSTISSRTIHFQSDDSMELTSVLPFNKIVINKDSELNITAQTVEDQICSTSNNIINIPDTELPNRRTIYFQSDDSVEFTSTLLTNNIAINDNSKLKDMESCKNLGLKSGNPSEQKSDLFIENETNNLNKIDNLNTELAHFKPNQNVPSSDTAATEIINDEQNVQQEPKKNMIPSLFNEMIPCNEDVKKQMDNIHLNVDKVENINSLKRTDLLPVIPSFDKKAEYSKVHNISTKNTIGDLKSPGSQSMQNNKSFCELMEVDSFKDSLNIENSYKENLKLNITDKCSIRTGNIVEQNENNVEEHLFGNHHNYSISNICPKRLAQNIQKTHVKSDGTENINSIVNSVVVSKASNPVEIQNVKPVTQIDKNSEKYFKSLIHPAENMLPRTPVININAPELQSTAETDHVVPTPSTSFLINSNTYSPCIEDTLQLIHATIPKLESFKLDGFDIVANEGINRIENTKDKCDLIANTTPITFEDANAVQDDEVESNGKSEANLENISDSISHCNNYTLRSRNILSDINKYFLEVDLEEKRKKLQLRFEKIKKSIEAGIEDDKITIKLAKHILTPKIQIINLEEMFKDDIEEIENSVLSENESEVEESMKVLNDSKTLYEKVCVAAERSETLWKFDKSKTTDDHYHFTALSDNIKFIVHLHPELGIVYDINAFEDTWGGCSSTRLFVHYKNNCFLNKMKKENLFSALGSKYEIFTLLDYVSMSLEEVSKFDQEYRELLDKYGKSHRLKMNPGFSISFEILSVDFMIWWMIEIKMALASIGSQESVTATYKMGKKVYEDEVKKIAENSTVGVKFLRSFIENLEEYKTRIGKRTLFETKGNNAFFKA